MVLLVKILLSLTLLLHPCHTGQQLHHGPTGADVLQGSDTGV